MAQIDAHTPMIQRPILLGIGHVASVQELRGCLERVVAGGFDGVEVALPASVGNGVAGAPQWLPDLLTTLAGTDPPVLAVAGRCLSTNVDSATDAVKSLLEQSAGVGAQCLNLTIPPLRGFGETEHGSVELAFERYQQSLNFAYAVMYRLRFESEAAGVALAVEAGTGGTLLSPVELRELIDEANSWAVGACVDVGRVTRFGLLDDWLLTLTHRVQSVRIPYPVTADPSKIASAVRTVEFMAIGDTLDEIGFTGPIIVDGNAEAMLKC